MQSGTEVISKIAWKIRPDDVIASSGIRVRDEKYLVSGDGSKERVTALFRVGVPEFEDENKMDYSSALRTTLHQHRMKGFFEGLRRASVPFIYTVVVNRDDEPEGENPVLEFDLLVGTWADGKKDRGEVEALVEQRASVLSATLTVALPDATVERLERRDLAESLKAIFLPGDRGLSQSGPAAAGGALCSFGDLSPRSTSVDVFPEFYIPNSLESGREGILLGNVRSLGGEHHEFRMQLDDLKRHVSVLGMTGSGKSTTAGTIVRQVAEMGLPTMVLDWHNEYGAAVSEAGGKVVSPGRDGFSVNPLEAGRGADPVEHLGMVSDIFSDIYHFTHPQAYMFRNALQKTAGPNGVPTIEGLVKTVESYPLRSAYDNETKVALLRRLVPLTQGQSGRALAGEGGTDIGELLSSVVCMELGHMRDIQARAVFADVMLKMVYEEKVRRKGNLDHVTVVEEARNIAPARRVEDPPSVGERMISELRKFGEAMMFVAQFPSHIASEVVKNSGSKIVHRLAWPDDVALMGDSLGLNKQQRQHLTRLRVGEAVVGLSRIQRPFLVQVRPEPRP